MIKLRYITTALIFNEDKVLLKKQSKDNNLVPDKWALVEGRTEPEGLSDPIKACIGEIEKETGLTKSDIFDLKLKYIVHVRNENEIRIQYVFSGLTQKSQLMQSKDSELVWINPREASDQKVALTTEHILSHYLAIGSKEDNVTVGTINYVNGIPTANWTPVKNWE